MGRAKDGDARKSISLTRAPREVFKCQHIGSSTSFILVTQNVKLLSLRPEKYSLFPTSTTNLIYKCLLVFIF